MRPKNIQIVPCYYAALLVHRRGITAKTAFQELYGAKQARREVEACQDVLTWLRVACTARGGEGLQNTVTAVFQQLTPVHLPPDVFRYMISKVRLDLPPLATPDAMTTEVTGTLAGALRALTSRAGGSGEDRAGREPKGINEHYKETYRPSGAASPIAPRASNTPLWYKNFNASCAWRVDCPRSSTCLSSRRA